MGRSESLATLSEGEKKKKRKKLSHERLDRGCSPIDSEITNHCATVGGSEPTARKKEVQAPVISPKEVVDLSHSSDEEDQNICDVIYIGERQGERLNEDMMTPGPRAVAAEVVAAAVMRRAEAGPRPISLSPLLGRAGFGGFTFPAHGESPLPVRKFLVL